MSSALEEAHSAIYGAHQSRPKLHFQLKKDGAVLAYDCARLNAKCEEV